jgi:hypothetical protein
MSFWVFLKGFLITAGFTAVGYFIIPFLLPETLHQAIFFSLVMTASNFIAIMYSWYYFSTTKCLGDEANLIAEYAYKFAGPTVIHVVFLIIRLSGNIITVTFVLLNPSTLYYEIPAFFNIKIYLFSIASGTAVYFYEMVNNIIAVKNGTNFKCNERSLLCESTKDPLFCS